MTITEYYQKCYGTGKKSTRIDIDGKLKNLAVN